MTTLILLLGSDLMCKAITRHCCSGKLLEKMHDVTFFHVFVVGGGGDGVGAWRWWSVAICIYKILYKQFSYFNTVCLKKYPGNIECVHSS